MNDAIQEKKVLPTERITFAKQLDILRAYGAQYEATSKPVKNEDVAKIVGMKDSTVSISNAFFSSTKLIQRVESGGYTPCPEVISFCRAYQWDKEKAPQKLAPAIEQMWFAKALLPKLKFSPIQETEAIQHLGEETATDKESEPRLKLLLDYLSISGLVIRENGQVKLVQQAPKPDGGDADSGKAGADKGIKPPDKPSSDTANLVQHALPLKGGRKIVVFSPPSISKTELKRIQDWLGLQLLIDEDTEGGNP